MKLAAVLVLTVAGLSTPASALAAPNLAASVPTVHIAQASGSSGQMLNAASDKTALNAYATYLSSVVKGYTTAEANGAAFITTISTDCKSALAPLAQPNNQVDTQTQQTLTALGEEMGDDLSISFDGTALTAFERLDTTLSRLKWTRLSGGGAIVRRYLNTESTVLEMLPSSLCQDAVLAASSPQIVPPGTKTFNKGYTKASNAANNALTNLTKLMQTYETYSERTIVARIANLASQVAHLSKSYLQQSAATLSSTLES